MLFVSVFIIQHIEKNNRNLSHVISSENRLMNKSKILLLAYNFCSYIKTTVEDKHLLRKCLKKQD